MPQTKNFFLDHDFSGVENFLVQFEGYNANNSSFAHLDGAASFASLRSHPYLVDRKELRFDGKTSIQHRARLEQYCRTGLKYIENNFSTSTQVQKVLYNILCASVGDEQLSQQILFAMIDNLKTVPQSNMSKIFLEKVIGIIDMLECRFEGDLPHYSSIADATSVVLYRQFTTMPVRLGKALCSIFNRLTEQDESERWKLVANMPIIFNRQDCWVERNDNMSEYLSSVTGRNKLGCDDCLDCHDLFIGPEVRHRRRSVIFWSSGYLPTVLFHANPLRPVQHFGSDCTTVEIDSGYNISRSNVSLKCALERFLPKKPENHRRRKWNFPNNK